MKNKVLQSEVNNFKCEDDDTNEIIKLLIEEIEFREDQYADLEKEKDDIEFERDELNEKSTDLESASEDDIVKELAHRQNLPMANGEISLNDQTKIEYFFKVMNNYTLEQIESLLNNNKGLLP